MAIQDLPQYEDFFQHLKRICQSAAELLHASASSIYLKEDDEVVMHAAYGYSDTLVHSARYKLGEGITGWVALRKENEFMANSKEEVSMHPHHLGKYDKKIWQNGKIGCYSMVAIPLLIGDDVYGLIKVENKRINKKCCNFNKEDLDRLRLFLTALSSGIQQNKDIMTALGKYFVFVVMPFKDDYLNIYDSIKIASKEADMFCTRSDEEPNIGKISERIYESIKKADVIVSVMTERNPNVFYETGYAHAMNKPTIHVAEKPEEIPFDLRDYSHVFYNQKDLPAFRSKMLDYLTHIKKNILTRNFERGCISV